MKKQLLMLIILSLFAIMGCSSGSGDSNSADGDGVIDGDQQADGDQTVADGDKDYENTKSCVDDGCKDGLYCDELDGLCKTCKEDSQCGDPDPQTRVFPLCIDGVCEKVACPAMVEIPVPQNGVEPSMNPLTPTFTADGVMVERTEMFPIVAQNLNDGLFDEAREAGFNVLITGQGCCGGNTANEDLPLQTDFLTDVSSENMYGAVHAVWPYDSYESLTLSSILQSTRDRANMVGLLFWLGGDRASQTDHIETVGDIRDDIFMAIDKKPFAIAEDWGFDPEAYADIADFFIVTLDPDSEIPAGEFSRLRLKTKKPMWVRMSPGTMSAEKMIAFAVQGIAYGARGLVFEFSDEMSGSPDGWSNARTAARYIRNLSNVWLSDQTNTTAFLQPDQTLLRMHAANFDGKTLFITVVNASNQTQEAELVLSDSYESPYCLGKRGEEQVLHLYKERTHPISLDAYEVAIYQVGVTGSPGEDSQE